MKYTIYLITITALFTACKPNIHNKSATETAEVITETPKAIDTIMTSEQATEQTNETPKVDLPFIGKKGFETRPGISGTGTPQRYIEIMINGDVYFGFEQTNQADNNITKERYYSGKFTTYMKSVFKNWDNEIIYYKITKDKIYEVDKSNKPLTGMECCSVNNSDLEDKCPCVSEYY